ncbi:MAG: YDG domain-containing protein [Roseburia sp.]
MKRNGKKHLAMLLAAVLTFAAVWQWMPVDVREVRAEEKVFNGVNTADELKVAFNSANENNTVTVRLSGSISLPEGDLENGAKFQLTSGNLTLDLNGCDIDASGLTSTNPIFSCSGGTLTIEDSVGNGYIQGANGGVCVKATGGTLNIEGGTFKTAKDGGDNDCALMMNDGNPNVTISGGNFESAHSAIWVMSSVKSGSSLNISGGTFTAEENGSYAYVCSVDGVCNVNISGGTFNLNPADGKERVGSSLVLGLNATDDMVNITGGTFHGRIARAISSTAQANYEVFYGNGSTGGIIGKSSVLTNNTFYLEYPDYNMYFTQHEVEVVPGSLVEFDTRRSEIETYTDNESALADTADYYSMDPISVTEDGKSVYANTNSHVLPTVDTNRITDGNTYTFSGWYDEKGIAYATLQDFIAKGYMAGAGKRVTLSAGWKAQVGDEKGLISALNKPLAVGEIELIKDIDLSETIGEDGGILEVPVNRNMDLGGHTIRSTADTPTDTTALVLSNLWNIKNGAINSSNQPCLEIGGSATIENLNCLAENASYAVRFNSSSGSDTVSSENRIISGVFEATGTEGHALCYVNASSEDITNLFGDSYASSTATVTGDDAILFLSASRLIVSQSPITYIGNGADLDLGSHVYGESVPVSTQIISNEAYVGDIVITGVSVDNPVFTVTGEGEPKYLRGGASQTESSYTYTVGVAENTDAGSYTGTATITYTKMDGSTGTYTQKLAVTITPKQLTIAEPTVTKEKVYDGTATAQVTAGALEGVVTGDEVTVSAEAAYDNADAGTGKKITVKYTLVGADQGNYLAPVNTEITDGQINKATGTGSVSMADYHVGETASSAVVSSQTNGTTGVTCYYKQKGAADDTYTTAVPTAEGSYTVKAVFAETTNYLVVEAEADFAVSYIATPETPYTLSGTAGKNGWYTSAVTIVPPEGYTIATDVNGTYGASYTVSATAEPVIYLKDGNGAVTKAIQVEKIWIDDKAPVITGVENGVNYHDGNRTAHITDENLKSVTLNGVNILFEGTTASILMKSSTKEYVLVAEDDAGNTVTYKFHVEKSISTEGVSQLSKGEPYKLGSGSWKVKGDSTVYNGNVTFYVSSDGEYEFQKQ